jgi:hypothetical protein
LKTPLIEAARRGDAITVERVLQQGADADVQDARGWTALHHAAAAGHAETAGCLLAYGASHALRDASGRGALDPESVSLEELHAIRQRYHRFRRSDEARSASSPSAERWARDLDRRGIVKIPGFVQAEELNLMRSEFETFVRSLRSKIARGGGRKRHYFEEEHWWPEERAFVTNNAFKHSAQLVRFSRRLELLEAARLYLGRPPFVQRAVAMRYLAGPSTESEMFAWHHDLEDKRFKVMILLSDVGPDDQHMSYVCGSHTLFHPHRMFLRNACDLEYCRQHLRTIEIYDATGEAGDVFLFDTNGAHRGVRRETGRVRDVYLVELNASAANVWGGDVDPSVLAEVRLHPDPFERLIAVEKKWDRPIAQRSPSWVESLPNVRAWL